MNGRVQTKRERQGGLVHRGITSHAGSAVKGHHPKKKEYQRKRKKLMQNLSVKKGIPHRTARGILKRAFRISVSPQRRAQEMNGAKDAT